MAPRSLLISTFLHILLAVFIIFGLPALPRDDLLIQPQVITVELDIAPVANAPTARKTPTKKPEEKKIRQAAKPEPVKEKPKKEEPKKPEPKPEPKKPEPKKEEKKPEPKPAPVKEKPKKEEPKKPEPKKDEPTLDDILKDLESDAPKTQEKPQDVAAEKHKNDIDSDVPYDPSMKLSQTVQDSIRNQIMECWNYQGGAKNQDSLVAYIQVTFKEDGSIIDAKLKASDQGRYRSDPAFRSLVDSARRATRNPKCVPLKGLPRDSYPAWSKVELVFDPNEMW